MEASFQGLVKTLFWILFIYYGLRVVGRLLLPVLAQKMVQKAQEQFQQQQQHYAQQQQQAQQPAQPTAPKEVVGEYIDFEEVND